MLSPDITLIYIIFISISLSAGIAAIYFWVKVYYETKKGSAAWLLLALTAIFLISTSLFPSVAVSVEGPYVSETILIYLGLWSAVYTSVFAAAGFMMYTAFRTIPREKLGDFLIEGMVFQKDRTEHEKRPMQKVQSDTSWDQIWPDQTANLFKRSTLLEYAPKTRYEDAVIEVCLRLYGEMVNTVLVSTQPRTAFYKEKLADLIDIGAMKFIEISSTEKTVSEDEGIIKLPASELDKFFDLTSKLPKDCAIVFEPLTHMIVKDGEMETYGFVSKMAEKASASELILIGLLNKTAHDEKIISRFEGLFLNIADVNGASIRVIKGGKEECLRFYAGEKFFMEQDNEKLEAVL